MARVHASLILILLAGCARSHIVEAGFDFPLPPEESASNGLESAACDEQLEASMDGIPEELKCTGLYSDLKKRTIAEGVSSFEPAYALWSDDSGKGRWIQLPEGEKIDSSNPSEWRFPLHTKF
jgi:hypothetical protein